MHILFSFVTSSHSCSIFLYITESFIFFASSTCSWQYLNSDRCCLSWHPDIINFAFDRSKMSLLYWNLKSGLLKEGYFGWNQLTSIHVEIAVKHHILCDSLCFYFSTNSWLFSNLQPWFDVSIVKAPVVFVMLEHDNNNFEAQKDLCALKTPHLSSFIPLTIEKTILWGV